MTLRIGDAAPEFALPDQSGSPVALSSFRGRPVVLFFYPHDYTPGCTKEACAFRDAYEDFADAGAAVIGIGGGSAGSHRGFAARFRLPFTVLTDPDGAVRAAYAVPRTLWVLPGRVTFVIDGAGIVRHVFTSQLQPGKHVAEALRVVRELAAGTRGARAAGE